MSAKKQIVIVGAGGHGREAVDIVEAMNCAGDSLEVVGFIDDGLEVGELAAPHDLPVIGGVDRLATLTLGVVLAIGDPRVRRKLAERITSFGRGFVSIVHPAASIGSWCEIGPGFIMAAGARLTHGVRVGAHVHMNVNSSVSHDCDLGDFVTVTPGVHVSGSVQVGAGVWLGIGSVIKQGVTVGDEAVVGAGAVVVDDLPGYRTAVGVPARPVPRELEAQKRTESR